MAGRFPCTLETTPSSQPAHLAACYLCVYVHSFAVLFPVAHRKKGESLEFSGVAGGKIEPGLSSFADAPKDAAEYISPLLARASELVPTDNHSSTKVRRDGCVIDDATAAAHAASVLFLLVSFGCRGGRIRRRGFIFPCVRVFISSWICAGACLFVLRGEGGGRGAVEIGVSALWTYFVLVG